MTTPLHPMSLGEILDRTFQIYRARFLAFVGIAAIPALAMALIHTIDSIWIHVGSLAQPFRQPGIFLWDLAVSLGFYHISVLLALLIEPAHVKIASSYVLGEQSSIVTSLKFVGFRWRTYFAIAAAKQLAQMLIPEILVTIVIFIGAVIANLAGKLDEGTTWLVMLIVSVPVLTGFGFFVWLGARLALAIPSSALETSVASKALRRSWNLTKGTTTRICFTWLVIFMSSWATTWGMRQVLWQLAIFLHAELHLTATVRILYLPLYYTMLTAVAILVGPIFPIALALFYYDQRIRHEGFDIERMMDAAGLNPPATLTFVDAPAGTPVDSPAAPQTAPNPTEEDPA
jgi:hypothetical protein